MVKVLTSNPSGFLDSIKQAIADESIKTWRETRPGSFTHTSVQWRNLAWFRATLTHEGIVFNIIRPKGGSISNGAYAAYHGYFSRTLLEHFDHEFSEIRISSLAAAGDLI